MTTTLPLDHFTRRHLGEWMTPMGVSDQEAFVEYLDARWAECGRHYMHVRHQKVEP